MGMRTPRNAASWSHLQAHPVFLLGAGPRSTVSSQAVGSLGSFDPTMPVRLTSDSLEAGRLCRAVVASDLLAPGDVGRQVWTAWTLAMSFTAFMAMAPGAPGLLQACLTGTGGASSHFCSFLLGKQQNSRHRRRAEQAGSEQHAPGIQRYTLWNGFLLRKARAIWGPRNLVHLLVVPGRGFTVFSLAFCASAGGSSVCRARVSRIQEDCCCCHVVSTRRRKPGTHWRSRVQGTHFLCQALFPVRSPCSESVRIRRYPGHGQHASSPRSTPARRRMQDAGCMFARKEPAPACAVAAEQRAKHGEASS